MDDLAGSHHRLVLARPQSAEQRWSVLEGARRCYHADARWESVRRGLNWRGDGFIVANLLHESQAMCEPELTVLRRSECDGRLVDEYAMRFVHCGLGIDGVELLPGDLIELHRVRILVVEEGRIRHETCVETWTVLASGPSGDARTSAPG